MKKFLLSFMILLGGVIGVQAQTFDFSCGPSAEELAFGFDRDQEPQFEADEIAMFSGTQFLQGGSSSDLPGDDGRVIDINHYVAIHDIPGTCNSDGTICRNGRVTIDAEDDGRFYVATINLQGRGGDYDTFAEAFAAANVIINDLDNNGFAVVEEEMLSDASFAPDSNYPGLFSRSYSDDGDEVHITVNPDGGFNVTNSYWSSSEDGYLSTYATFDLAMAAALVIING